MKKQVTADREHSNWQPVEHRLMAAKMYFQYGVISRLFEQIVFQLRTQSILIHYHNCFARLQILYVHLGNLSADYRSFSLFHLLVCRLHCARSTYGRAFGHVCALRASAFFSVCVCLFVCLSFFRCDSLFS